MDIKQYVIEDYDNSRDNTQYRARFIINTDWDYWWDKLIFLTANTPEYKPYIQFIFSN